MNYEKYWFLTPISTYISIFLVICFFSKSFVLISNRYCVSQKEANQIIASFLLRGQKVDLDHQDFMQHVYCIYACSVAQWCPTLQCYGLQSARLLLFQVRKLEWVAISSSRGSSQLKVQTRISYVSCIGNQMHCISYSLKWMLFQQGPMIPQGIIFSIL